VLVAFNVVWDHIINRNDFVWGETWKQNVKPVFFLKVEKKKEERFKKVW